jgi:hypothetical protein
LRSAGASAIGSPTTRCRTGSSVGPTGRARIVSSAIRSEQKHAYPFTARASSNATTSPAWPKYEPISSMTPLVAPTSRAVFPR